jgi:hypothetical protein
MVNPIEALRQKSLQSGIQRVFSLAILAAGDMVQYTREHELIRGVLQDYKNFNAMLIENNSTVNIAVDPDFTEGKRLVIPANTIISKDMMNYLEFEVHNMSASTATAADEVVITAIYERQLKREAF